MLRAQRFAEDREACGCSCCESIMASWGEFCFQEENRLVCIQSEDQGVLHEHFFPHVINIPIPNVESD